MNRIAHCLKTAAAIALTSAAFGAFAQDAVTTTSTTHKTETTAVGGADAVAKTRAGAHAAKRHVHARAKTVNHDVKADTKVDAKNDAKVSTTTSTTDAVRPGATVSSTTTTTK